MALPDPKMNLPAGEILAPQRLAAATAGSSACRDRQGRARGTPKGSRLAADPLKAFTDGYPCWILPWTLAAVLSGGPRLIRRYREWKWIGQSPLVGRADESGVHARARIRDQGDTVGTRDRA